MIRKIVVLTAILLSVFTDLYSARYENTIPVLKGEKWWGGFVTCEAPMPLSKPFARTLFGRDGYRIPMLISSRGRYIWSGKPFSLEFTGKEFKVGSDFENIKVGSGGRTLREAYLVCCHKNFPPSGKLPSAELFQKPLYDTRGALPVGFSSGDVMDYARRIKDAGYPAGIIILGSDWQSFNGSFTFSSELFRHPKDMVDQLHGMGFKVMVEITPLVTPDNSCFRLAREKDQLLKDESGKPRIIEWNGGYSACYDITDPEVAENIKQKLTALKNDVGVDGFVFDSDGADNYISDARGGHDEYIRTWKSLGADFDLCQYRIIGGSNYLAPYISAIECNEAFGWDFIRHYVADVVMANLLAHPYTSVSMASMPRDSVGGELMLRYVQLLAATPVMHVSSEPWAVADGEYAQRIKDAFRFREVIGGYIAEQLKGSAHIAEPIVRHMEYAFPRNGFADCNDQFMIGTKYLVAPVLDDSGKRLVRFPRGIWVDREGRRYRGPLVAEIDCRGGMIPCFELSK